MPNMNEIHTCDRTLFALTVSVCNVSGGFVFFIYHQHSHLAVHKTLHIASQCNCETTLAMQSVQ